MRREEPAILPCYIRADEPRRLAAFCSPVFRARRPRRDDRPRWSWCWSIDGLPQEQVVKYRDLYGTGGFKRLLDEGAWFGNAHHMHAVTLTAPGPRDDANGQLSVPQRHHRQRVGGPQELRAGLQHGRLGAHYIGDETKKLDGTSPARLRVTTVGDELRYSNNGQSKVIADLGQGPRRDPARRQARHGLHVHGPEAAASRAAPTT
jgi:hypothetical protein